jgi:HAD superfamily hydrolase (TIGR01509 family)
MWPPSGLRNVHRNRARASPKLRPPGSSGPTRRAPLNVIDAVVFDLDGVLVDSDHVWHEVREGLARERGGRWSDQSEADMSGMSSNEWSRYLHEVVGIIDPPEEINREVVRRMRERYAALPLAGGAADTVTRLGYSFRIALASSSNRPLIDAVLNSSGLAEHFEATVSFAEVARGKPSPDVFLEAARRLGVPPNRCAAVEDSANGLRAAHAAGMKVIALPNRRYPTPVDALVLADVTLASLAALTVDVVRT